MDSTKKITGARTVKQVILVNGLPFEIKNIFGLSNPDEINSVGQASEIKGQAADKEEAAECTICLSETANTILMPCGHMCVCLECAKAIQKSKHNHCPICRGTIQSLIPMKKG